MSERIDEATFLEAYEKNCLNLTATGKALGIKHPRDYVYNHKKKNPEFAEAYEEIRERLKDNVESELYRKIFEDKNIAAIIFFLKTQCKDRGYIERQELTATEDQNVTIKVETIISDKKELNGKDITVALPQEAI